MSNTIASKIADIEQKRDNQATLAADVSRPANSEVAARERDRLTSVLEKQADRTARQVAADLSWAQEKSNIDHKNLLTDPVYFDAVQHNNEHVMELFKSRKMKEGDYLERIKGDLVGIKDVKGTDAVNLREDEVILNCDDAVYELLTEQLPSSSRDSIHRAISVGINSGKLANIVVGKEYKERTAGFQATVGEPIFDGIQNPIARQGVTVDLRREEKTKIIYLLRIESESEAKKYKLTPISYEIPGKGSFVMDGMHFNGVTPLETLKKILSTPETSLVL